jgi:hypothetical protein
MSMGVISSTFGSSDNPFRRVSPSSLMRLYTFSGPISKWKSSASSSPTSRLGFPVPRCPSLRAHIGGD